MKDYESVAFGVFGFRMNMLFEAHGKHLLGKITRKLMKESTLEEKDSILMGLLETSNVQEASS